MTAAQELRAGVARLGRAAIELHPLEAVARLQRRPRRCRDGDAARRLDETRAEIDERQATDGRIEPIRRRRQRAGAVDEELHALAAAVPQLQPRPLVVAVQSFEVAIRLERPRVAGIEVRAAPVEVDLRARVEERHPPLDLRVAGVADGDVVVPGCSEHQRRREHPPRGLAFRLPGRPLRLGTARHQRQHD
jgi:hypothetical protein